MARTLDQKFAELTLLINSILVVNETGDITPPRHKSIVNNFKELVQWLKVSENLDAADYVQETEIEWSRLIVGFTLDNGHVCENDETVLLTNQTNLTENGIWQVRVAGEPTRPTNFTPLADQDGCMVLITKNIGEDNFLFKIQVSGYKVLVFPLIWSSGVGHLQNTDVYLNYGGIFQVSAQEIWEHIHSTMSPQEIDITDLTEIDLTPYPDARYFLLYSTNEQEIISSVIDSNSSEGKQITLKPRDNGLWVILREALAEDTPLKLLTGVDFIMKEKSHYSEFRFTNEAWSQAAGLGIRDIVMIGENWRMRDVNGAMVIEKYDNGDWVEMSNLS